jgi:hypothetical protein
LRAQNAIGREVDGEAGAFEHSPEEHACGTVVVDDEHGRCGEVGFMSVRGHRR